MFVGSLRELVAEQGLGQVAGLGVCGTGGALVGVVGSRVDIRVGGAGGLGLVGGWGLEVVRLGWVGV